MKDNTKNIFKKSVFLTILLIVVTIVASVIVKYNVEGEKDLPYSINKILITSHVLAKDSKNQKEGVIWNIDLKTDNDIYIYINKKDDKTKEKIKEVKISNFKIEEKPKIGNVKIYKPTGDLGSDLYRFSEQDYLNGELTYTGASVDTLKDLDIRNEGGMIGFRASLENLGNYTSNESVVYNGSLLSKIGVKNKDMKFKLSFDLTITLDSNISFTGKVSLDLPAGDIINEEEPHIEITDFSNVIFKRN